MANELAKTEAGMINMQTAFRGLQHNGLVLPANMKFEDWRLKGQALGVLGQAVPWAIGDWLNYGERAYGSKYTEAMKVTGYSYKTCLNLKYVASRIDISRRKDLSFGHHSAVAAYPPNVQDEVLQEAYEQNLSVIQVRTLLRSRGLEVEGRETAIETTATPVQEAIASTVDITSRRVRSHVRRLLHNAVPMCEALLESIKLELAEDSPQHMQDVVVRFAALTALNEELSNILK